MVYVVIWCEEPTPVEILSFNSKLRAQMFARGYNRGTGQYGALDGYAAVRGIDGWDGGRKKLKRSHDPRYDRSWESADEMLAEFIAAEEARSA